MLRSTVVELTAQIGELESTQARYTTELATAQAQFDGVDPDTADWAALSAVAAQERVYTTELARIRSDLAPLRNKLDVMAGHLADEETKIAVAQAFVDKLHGFGLAAFPNKSVAEVQTEYERSLGRLAAAGIVVERRDIAVGIPRWARPHVPPTVSSGESTNG